MESNSHGNEKGRHIGEGEMVEENPRKDEGMMSEVSPREGPMDDEK